MDKENKRAISSKEGGTLDKKHVFLVILLLFVDIILILLVFTPTIVLNAGIAPFRRGFYCDDESLMHPYKDDTVSIAMVAAVGLGLPLLAFILTEWAYYSQLRNASFQADDLVPRDFGCCRLPALVNNILYSIVNLLGGLAVVLTVTEVGKETVGRLRPHFFSACRPNWTAITCQTKLMDASDLNIMNFVENYQCMETNQFKVLDAAKSFPSGHSSFSMFCMVFLALYVQYRIHWNKLYFLKMFLQTVFFLMALYTALSRISDYKHHWSDVLSGSLLGIVVAFYVMFAVWRLPQRFWIIERQLTKNPRSNQIQPFEQNPVNEASSIRLLPTKSQL